MRVSVRLPESARHAVPAIEEALATYLFEGQVAVD